MAWTPFHSSEVADSLTLDAGYYVGHMDQAGVLVLDQWMHGPIDHLHDAEVLTDELNRRSFTQVPRVSCRIQQSWSRSRKRAPVVAMEVA